MEQTPIQSPVTNYASPGTPPAPPVSSIPPAPRMITSGNHRGMFLKIIGLVVILAIIGTVAVLATRIFDPLWNPFRPNPQAVLDVAFNKINGWKTSTMGASMNFRIKDDNQKIDINILANGTGITDITDISNPKSSSVLNISSDIGVGGAIYKINIVFQQIQVNNNLAYLNLQKIELPQTFSLFLPLLGIDINKIQNQWIKIDAQEIQQLVGVANSAPAITEDQQKQLTEQIKQIFFDAKINKIKEQLPNESIDNQKMYHYLATLDKNELKKAGKDFINILGSTLGNLPDVSEVDSQFDKAILAIGDIDYQIWIGQQDEELHKIKFAKVIDASKFGPNQKGSLEIGFELDYSEINKPVVIIEPATSKTFKEVFPFIEQTIATQKEQARMGSMTQLNNIAKSIRASDGNFNNFKCSDARVKPFCDNIKNIVGQDPIIYQSNDKYCGYVKVLLTNKYICIAWKGTIPSVGSYTNSPTSTCTRTKFACPSK